MRVRGIYEDESGEEKPITKKQKNKFAKQMIEAAASIYNYEITWEEKKKII